MNYKAKIKITLREGILDVQGKAVENALHSIDFQNMNNVRIGKYVELFVNSETENEAYKYVENACNKLIANPIIEDFKINLEQV